MSIKGYAPLTKWFCISSILLILRKIGSHSTWECAYYHTMQYIISANVFFQRQSNRTSAEFGCKSSLLMLIFVLFKQSICSLSLTHKNKKNFLFLYLILCKRRFTANIRAVQLSNIFKHCLHVLFCLFSQHQYFVNWR